MDTITIGLLLPSSTIFPISKDFEKGLKESLNHVPDGLEIEIVKEFVGQGDLKMSENACNKFFNYDDVDLVTGIVSNRVAQVIAERFKGEKKPLLISNLGGHIPNVTEFNEYIFVNSLHLWRHAWTLGHYGVKNFGKKGMFIGSVYDAGYSFSHMLYEGMRAADKDSFWSFSVPPMPPPGELSNMDVIFPFLEEYQPDFIFPCFCGAETTLFLNEFIKGGWHHKTKVLALPYLLAPFAPINDNITIYTAAVFEEETEIAPAKAFYHLGIQAGQIIAQAAATATDASSLKNKIAKLNRTFNVSDLWQPATNPAVTIIQNDIKAGENSFTSKAIGQHATFELDIEQMRPLTAELAAAWYNPYLCI